MSPFGRPRAVPGGERGPIAAVALLLAALIVVPIVRPAPLVDPDEGLHAAISQEMIARGDYVTPRFLGEPFLDKPILFFWAQAASLRVFGESEIAARVPGFVFGVLGAITVGWLAAVIIGDPLGWVAAICYLTMVVPAALMEIPVHDVALVPFVNVALLALWRATRAGGSRAVLKWSAAAGAALGLSVLTKGLTGFAIVGITHAILLTLERRWSVRVVAGGLLAVLIALAIAAPWYLEMERLHPGYLHYYFVERHVEGFAEETQRHSGRPWWYYVPVLAGGALPWTAFVPLTIARWRDAAGERAPGDAAARRLGWTWLIAGGLFLSSAGAKLFTYVLPLFPAVALLAALACVRYARTRRPGAPGRPLTGLGAAVVVLAIGCAALVPVSAATAALWLHVPIGPGVWIAAVLAGALWTGAVRAWRTGGTWPLASALAAALTFGAILGGVLPAAATRMTGRDLAAALNARGLPAEVWVVRDRIGSVVFYLRPDARAALTRDRIRTIAPRELRVRTAGPDTLVAIADAEITRVSHFVVLAHVPFERAGQYRLYRAGDLGVARRPSGT